jgi:hypothetical protein
MITDEQYREALEKEADAKQIIRQYFAEKEERLQKRLADGEPLTDEELKYSAVTLCPCGHGLAYPKEASPHHYWDCSAILKGIADKTVDHTAKLPFMYYDVKGESEERGTTRGVFRPKTSGVKEQ